MLRTARRRRAFAAFLVALGIASSSSIQAAQEFRGKPLPESWRQVMDAGYALDVRQVPAADVCLFFQKTVSQNFFCSNELRGKRVVVQMKGPFNEVFDVFLKRLDAEACFAEHYVFIGKRGDAGLEAYSLPPELPSEMTQDVALAFTQMQIADITGSLTKATGIPIVVAPALQSRRVTVMTKKIPFIEAMEVIARSLRAPLAVLDQTVILG